ncbi:hypothetical protein HDE68_002516 [Pedobacter cryoconitis]|uniref:Uncharacterized protein n=1 Tax=Pedobacter cryoconitis TaxID=188932 RepID=A0A7W8ZMK7_9SPHI|nr:hypothetical protein [Pedobacter cryoconitis]
MAFLLEEFFLDQENLGTGQVSGYSDVNPYHIHNISTLSPPVYGEKVDSPTS